MKKGGERSGEAVEGVYVAGRSVGWSGGPRWGGVGGAEGVGGKKVWACGWEEGVCG